ncbi:MAG: hypothetical protein P8Z42_06425 [Anaerolineales bacterium]|jgi:hypothetical protein
MKSYHLRKSAAAWMCLVFLFLASLSCALPTNQSSGSVEATQLALEVEATTLALQKAVLTQAAESQEESAAPPDLEEPAVEEETADTTPTSTVEAEEESSGAVEGSLERASYDPAYGWGAGHDSDNFDGATGKFPSSSAGAATAWYGDGRFNITFTSRNRWTWYWSFIDAADFYADFLVYNGDQCVSGDTAGFVFRGHKDADYGLMFGISCGGEYFIGFTAVPGSDGVIFDFSEAGVIDPTARTLYPSDLIQPGPGAVNRVGVMARGDDIDFYINGKWVANRSVANYTPGVFVHGNFALYLGTAQKPNASVSFDDFNIWYLD